MADIDELILSVVREKGIASVSDVIDELLRTQNIKLTTAVVRRHLVSLTRNREGTQTLMTDVVRVGYHPTTVYKLAGDE